MIDNTSVFTIENFIWCNTMGGHTASGCSLLYYHKGVFIGFVCDEWTVLLSSDPRAKWNSSPMDMYSKEIPLPVPINNDAKLWHYNNVPDEVQNAAKKHVMQAIEICRKVVEERAVFSSRQMEYDLKKMKDLWESFE